MTNQIDLTNFGIIGKLRHIERGSFAMGDVIYELLADDAEGASRYMLVLDGIPSHPFPVDHIVTLLDEHLAADVIRWLEPTGSTNEGISTNQASSDFERILDKSGTVPRMLLEVSLGFGETSYGP